MLFIEDFDAVDEPPPPEAPEAPARDFDAELAAEYARGRAEAEGQAQDAAEQAAQALVAQCVTECRQADAAVADMAEAAADQLARLVFDALDTLVPSVCAACGPRETAAMARLLLPRLRCEPRIRVRLNPHEAAAVQAEVARLEEELADRIVVTPSDAVARGDLRVSWQDGSMLRDTAAIWRATSEVLQQFGFLDAPAPGDGGGLAGAMMAQREQVAEHAR